ncbi:MAG: hypothetical protein DRN49_03520 [Thaumarchaeota archaeon]|nr:MAG: hypothetical protein DRN49_03520 [Nitrososphaerota archaeon]
MVDLKHYTFTKGTITSNSAGIISAVYTAFPIKGKIDKIAFKAGDMTATGSLMIFTSGGELVPSEMVFIKKDNLDTDAVWYPRTDIVNSGATAIGAGSGNIWTENVVNDKLYVVGSGCGNTKTLSGLTIYYW